MNSGSSELLISGGRLVDGEGDTRDNPGLLVRDGRLAVIGAQAAAQAAPDCERIDASGWMIAPGFVDLCCNLCEPGNGQKGNIASESRAAAHGGFTTVCASPDTSPVNDSRAVTYLIRDSAADRSLIRVLPVGALTRGLEGELLSDMAGLQSAGCVAVGNGSRPVRDHNSCAAIHHCRHRGSDFVLL